MRITALILLLIACAGCKRTTAPETAGLVTHKDPHGFSLGVPAGWNVSADAKSGRVTASGPERQQVVVWPVFIPAGMDAGSAPSLLRRLASSAGFRQFVWGTPRPAGPAAMRMEGEQGESVAVAAFAWSESPKGTAGQLYVAAAPKATYRAEPFAQILESFEPAGAPAEAKPAAPAVTYQRWRDPLEGAFSLEAPAGWKIEGGTHRFASIDTRTAVSAVSPDGQIRVAFGDKDIPPFTEPNQMLDWTGFREGTWYSSGYGLRMLVKRYAPGTAFVRDYIATKAAAGCAPIDIKQARPRPDADSALNRLYGQSAVYGVSVVLQSGDAAFECDAGGRPMAGYWFAGTLRTQTGAGVSTWHVQHLYGYLAPRDKAAIAQEVMNRMLASFQVDTDWARMQGRLTMETSRIVSETSQELSRISSETYWHRQRVMDEISRRRSNAMLGVEDVVDPLTGRQYRVESGSNYYWIDHRGRIVGTETYSRPNIDFRELTRLP